MSENSEKMTITKSKVPYSNILFCPTNHLKPEYIQLAIILAKMKQQILTSENLELDNVCYFWSINVADFVHRLIS